MQCTIRKATSQDFPEIKRLLREARLEDAAALIAQHEESRAHLLVLDAPDGRGLAAVALLNTEGERGKLGLLAVDVRYHGIGIEDRLVGVAQALCRAFGAHELEVNAISMQL